MVALCKTACHGPPGLLAMTATLSPARQWAIGNDDSTFSGERLTVAKRSPSARVARQTIDSPLGPLTLVAGEGRLLGLFMVEHRPWPRWLPVNATEADRSPSLTRFVNEDDIDFATENNELFADVTAQLAEYFSGQRETFTIPLAWSGSPFQERVWQELAKIPYGATVSYGSLARTIGRPLAARAVGSAVGRNPISIIVPCHRVLAATVAWADSRAGSGGSVTSWSEKASTVRRDLEQEITDAECCFSCLRYTFA